MGISIRAPIDNVPDRNYNIRQVACVVDPQWRKVSKNVKHRDSESHTNVCVVLTSISQSKTNCLPSRLGIRM